MSQGEMLRQSMKIDMRKLDKDSIQDYNATSTKSSSGRWTQEEHQRFVDGIKIYGKNWKKVEEYIKTRSGAQIRSHAQKFFNKVQKGMSVDKNDQLNTLSKGDKDFQSDYGDKGAEGIRKRNYSEFISSEKGSNVCDEKFNLGFYETSQYCPINIEGDLKDLNLKLDGLCKQIESSVSGIQLETDEKGKQQKLAVWKNVITSIIGLTGQFVDELDINSNLNEKIRSDQYKGFLNKLKTQLIDLNQDSKENVLNDNLLSDLIQSREKEFFKQDSVNKASETFNLVTIRRVHSLSADDMSLGIRIKPKQSDIVQLPFEGCNRLDRDIQNENMDNTNYTSKPSFKIIDESQDKLFKFEKFRKDSNNYNFEQGRKRFMSFNQF